MSEPKDQKDQNQHSKPKNSRPLFEHFCHKIKNMPKVLKKASIVDQTTIKHFDEIKKGADDLLDELKQKKEEWLKGLHGLILPAAREVLEELSKDGENLKGELDEILNNLGQAHKKDWIDQAKCWVRLYSNWQDQHGLMQRVLERVSHKTKLLIDRDIKVISEYKDQSLASLSKESEEFQDLELRLKIATDDALHNLLKLKSAPENLSMPQTLDWIVNIHAERQKYFEQVLMKIDNIVKEVVGVDNGKEIDQERHGEIEGEIKFIKTELQHISQLIQQVDLKDENELEFLRIRLRGVKEHLDEMNSEELPYDLKEKFQKLYEIISDTLKKINYDP